MLSLVEYQDFIVGITGGLTDIAINAFIVVGFLTFFGGLVSKTFDKKVLA